MTANKPLMGKLSAEKPLQHGPYRQIYKAMNFALPDELYVGDKAAAMRKSQIEDIIARGKTVVFKDDEAGVVKKTTKWNQPAEMHPGQYDLLCEESTGLTKWVCYAATKYTITEE